MEWYRTFFSQDYLRFDRHEDTSDEVSFLQDRASLPPGAKVLDLCCGYGRHAIELARRGCRVTGLDLSPTMLRRARQDASDQGVETRWVRGDMRALPLLEAFDAAISMFTSFGYFEDEDENFNVLEEVARVLVPGGRFLIETVNRDFLARYFERQSWLRPEGMTVLEERTFDPIGGRSRVDVTVIEGAQERRYFHSVRLYTFTELQMLMQAAGLVVTDVWGDFAGGAYDWDASRMIVLAEKRAGHKA